MRLIVAFIGVNIGEDYQFHSVAQSCPTLRPP